MAKVESTRTGLKFSMDEASNSRTDPSYTQFYIYTYTTIKLQHKLLSDIILSLKTPKLKPNTLGMLAISR